MNAKTGNIFSFTGYARVFGDDVDTDAIIPAAYLNLTDKAAIAPHCMEEIAPGFSIRVKEGDILVAGRNFGCGSSREHAPLAIMGCGISCVIARSFSRLFYRNAVNIGLPVIPAEDLSGVSEGDELTADCLTGEIRNGASGKKLVGRPLPAFMLEILESGGLIGYLERHGGAKKV